MRCRSSFYSLAVLVACYTTPAARADQAEQITVADLAAMCAETSQAAQNGCRLYILGTTEGFSLGAAGTRTKNKSICLPAGVPAAHLVSLMKSKMRDDLALYPKDAELAAVGFIAAVMTRQYPCGTEKP